MDYTLYLITKLKEFEFPININNVNNDYVELLLSPSQERYVLIEWLLNK